MCTEPTGPGKTGPREVAAVIQNTLREGESFRLLATGNSMYPFLRTHLDSVVLLSPEQLPPQKNDIVLFERRGEAPEKTYVLHRILRTLPGGGLVMNGDAQAWVEYIEPEQIIGVADCILRGGHTISRTGFWYRLLSGLWRLTRPIRGPLSRFYTKIHQKRNGQND